jgi:hypothetical protein
MVIGVGSSTVMGAFGGSAIGRLGMTIEGGFTGAGGELASQFVAGGPLNVGIKYPNEA